MQFKRWILLKIKFGLNRFREKRRWIATTKFLKVNGVQTVDRNVLINCGGIQILSANQEPHKLILCHRFNFFRETEE